MCPSDITWVMAAELADTASCSSDTTAPDLVPAALCEIPSYIYRQVALAYTVALQAVGGA